MKKIFLLIIISLCLTNSCFSKTKYSTTEDLEKISKETKACINRNHMTDYDMMQCTIEGTKKYHTEIKKTTIAAKDLLSKPQYEQFLKTQQKREEFIANYDKLLKQTFEKKYTSYLPCLTAAGHKYHFIKYYTEDLSGFFHSLTFFEKEGVLDDNLNFIPFKN